ncbi:MAG: hypothetical protein WAN75_35925 [Xanthobacteraceae bacterium]|jgi:hypothetical protein
MIGFAHNRTDTAPGFVLGYLQTNVDDRRSKSGLTSVLVHCATIFDVFRKRSQLPQTKPTVKS